MIATVSCRRVSVCCRKLIISWKVVFHHFEENDNGFKKCTGFKVKVLNDEVTQNESQ